MASQSLDRSVAAALVLTFLFGPLGLLYVASWWAVLLAVAASGIFILFTFGFGAFLVWPIAMVWAAVAASNRHSQFLRSLNHPALRNEN